MRTHPENESEQVSLPTEDEYWNANKEALLKSLEHMIKKYQPMGDNVSIKTYKARQILNHQFYCAKRFLEMILSNQIWDAALRRYYLSPEAENNENKLCYCPCSSLMPHWKLIMHFIDPPQIEGLTC